MIIGSFYEPNKQGSIAFGLPFGENSDQIRGDPMHDAWKIIGWTTAAIILLLCLYAGSYYGSLSILSEASMSPMSPFRRLVAQGGPIYRWGGDFADAFYSPMRQADFALRGESVVMHFSESYLFGDGLNQ